MIIAFYVAFATFEIFSVFLEYCVMLLSNVFFRRTIGLRFHESVLSILLPLSMDDLDDFFLFFSACEETPPLFGGKSAIFNKKICLTRSSDYSIRFLMITLSYLLNPLYYIHNNVNP